MDANTALIVALTVLGVVVAALGPGTKTLRIVWYVLAGILIVGGAGLMIKRLARAHRRPRR
ncbi:MAG: hypothetical protein ACLPZR_07685 [Solirubrobacteraceae bacterium]